MHFSEWTLPMPVFIAGCMWLGITSVTSVRHWFGKMFSGISNNLAK